MPICLAVPQNLQIMRDPSVSSFSPSADSIIPRMRGNALEKFWNYTPQISYINHPRPSFLARSDLSIRLHASRIPEYIYESRDVFIHARSNHLGQFAAVSSIFRNIVSRHPSPICPATPFPFLNRHIKHRIDCGTTEVISSRNNHFSDHMITRSRLLATRQLPTVSSRPLTRSNIRNFMRTFRSNFAPNRIVIRGRSSLFIIWY